MINLSFGTFVGTLLTTLAAVMNRERAVKVRMTMSMRAKSGLGRRHGRHIDM